MNFDVDRLAKLAGLHGDSGSSLLSEAGNRSYHEDPALDDEADRQFGKNQLSEVDYQHEDDQSAAGDGGEDGEDGGGDTGVDEGGGGSDGGVTVGEPQLVREETYEENIVLDINEEMLRREILNMRKRRIEENKLRLVVRNEINHILDDIDLNTGSDWIYGKNKPTNSRTGQISRGFSGFGFKR